MFVRRDTCGEKVVVVRRLHRMCQLPERPRDGEAEPPLMVLSGWQDHRFSFDISHFREAQSKSDVQDDPMLLSQSTCELFPPRDHIPTSIYDTKLKTTAESWDKE